MKDKISVIVPIYKVEEYLNRCIDSIINQTYSNLEIILVDDGSPDDCGKICDEYAKKDKRIKVLHKENGGLSDARNRGVEVASGKYVCFIDSDDFVNPLMIEVLYNNLIKYKADLSICNYKQTSKSDIDTVNISSENTKVFEGASIMNNLYNDLYVVTEVAWNKLYKKDVWKNIKYPFGKIHEDAYVIHHILNACKKVVYSDLKLYYYFERENSITKVFNEKRFDALGALKDRIDFFKKIKREDLHYRSIINYLKTIGFFYIDAARYAETKESQTKLKKIFKDELEKYNIEISIPLKNKIQYLAMLKMPRTYKFLRENFRLKKGSK